MTALSDTGALVAAPFIGFAFGWFLERGGLGCAPILAGQFYLTSLTVFKVFFTALLTAMLGLFWLDFLGVFDLASVSIPETFVLPQAIGGAIFGAGFLVAGLCPGTSCVAAAAGRLDGLAVIGGMLGGVVVFNAAFPLIAGFYNSTAWGAVKFTELLNLSPGVGVALVTSVALGGFYIASRIEKSRV